jgi:hypothetical protein
MPDPLDDALRTGRLDLHGRTKAEAEAALRAFVAAARARGTLAVAVIHGHGTGVLREHVRKLLDGMPDAVADYGPLPPGDGVGVKVRLRGAPAATPPPKGRAEHVATARDLLRAARRLDPPAG